MFNKILIPAQEIGRFRVVPVLIGDSGLKEHNNVSTKRVFAGKDIVLDATVASGRAGVFNYIELANINETINVGGVTEEYFGSPLEDMVLGFFAGLLGRADLFHVEYYKDIKTRNELQRGVPPVLSRLGFKLFELGFTWFKDWYIAEGWLEGPIKLSAEKPLDKAMIVRNLESVKKDIDRYPDAFPADAIRERAKTVRRKIDDYLDEPNLLLTP